MRRDPIVYFAGPAQHSWCSWLEGHHVLESYANHLGPEGCGTDALSRYRPLFASMALDPGAYSNMTARRAWRADVVTLEGYCDFASRYGDFYDWCASFDDIEGGADGNLRNWEACKRASIPRLMPVFHQGEPLDLLREYVRQSKYVGLGFQRPIRNEATWLDACFAEIPEGTWVHGFAMTNYMAWPFTSTDSKTWLHEVLAMEQESGQGRSALAFLTKRELLEIVVKKYQREWKLVRGKWRDGQPLMGVAAGRGMQIELEEALHEASNDSTAV